MKTIKYLVCALVITCSLSCKDEKAVAPEPEKKELDVFTFTLNGVVNKDDAFQIFYKEGSDLASPFEEQYSVFSEFKGSDKPQDIVFKLPEDVFPTQLRFDFGNNKEQSEIVINSFQINYKGKTFEIKGTDFFTFFRPEEAFMKVDKATAKVKPFITEDGTYDPMFFSEANLNNELVKLSK